MNYKDVIITEAKELASPSSSREGEGKNTVILSAAKELADINARLFH